MAGVSVGVERTRRAEKMRTDERWWMVAGMSGEIVDAVAVAAGVAHADIRGGKGQVRTPPVIAARRAAVVLLRLARLSYPQVAHSIGMSVSGVQTTHADAWALLNGRDTRARPLPAGTFEDNAEHLLRVLERAAEVVLAEADKRVGKEPNSKGPNSKWANSKGANSKGANSK